MKHPRTRLSLLLTSVLLTTGQASATQEDGRFLTDRPNAKSLELTEEEDSFVFAIFGDRTGGPDTGVAILADAVADVNLLKPDLVMTVGDLVQGYNEAPLWHVQTRQFQSIMGELTVPWYPVAGNHDVYYRGENRPPEEHEVRYEEHFGPLWYAFRHKNSWFLVLYTDEPNPVTGERNFNKPECQNMSPEQFAWLEGTLKKTADADHVFVFLHHPRWLGRNYGDDWERVHRLLASAGNVHGVFAGHIHHMRYDGKRDGIEYFTLATVGGGQVGDIPKAGYLHQYHLVNVRKDEVSVTSYPVGAAIDPRAVTGEVSELCRRAANELRPRILAPLEVAADGSVEGTLEVEVRNPIATPLEITLTLESGDSRWISMPDHAHTRLEGGGSQTFAFELMRGPTELDASFRGMQVVLASDFLGDGVRIPLPTRTATVGLDLSSLPEPTAPETEQSLHLDGNRGHLRVSHGALDLPDGPFTLETWYRANEFRSRQGILNKTENSEFGFFLSNGRPEFFVHLGGKYHVAQSAEPMLETNAWTHLAGVFDGNEVRVYVNGQLVGRTPARGARTLRDLPFLIGADVDGNGNPTSSFFGEIDEVRLSTTARYSGDSFQPERRHEADDRTHLLLHMDAVIGPWVYDSSGHGRHPEIRGGAHVRSAQVPR